MLIETEKKISVAEAAALFRVTERTMRRWCHDLVKGQRPLPALPGFNVGVEPHGRRGYRVTIQAVS